MTGIKGKAEKIVQAKAALCALKREIVAMEYALKQELISMGIIEPLRIDYRRILRRE